MDIHRADTETIQKIYFCQNIGKNVGKQTLDTSLFSKVGIYSPKTHCFQETFSKQLKREHLRLCF